MSLEEERLTNNNNNNNNIDGFDDLNLIIKRPIYNQKKFDLEFLDLGKVKHEERKSRPKRFLHRLKRVLHHYHPRKLLGLFTILNLISEYNFKKYLIGDIISGLTSNSFFISFSYRCF
jgi:hypothetical protein